MKQNRFRWSLGEQMHVVGGGGCERKAKDDMESGGGEGHERMD